MNDALEQTVAFSILSNVSSAIAIFDVADYSMEWRNAFFRRLTWLGAASGGKNATQVTLWDLFDERDFEPVRDLASIAVEHGRAYDFLRRVRRGPNGFFPAELNFYRVGTSASGSALVCMEVVDISLYKSYDEIESMRV
jgi:hypothetical protein